MGKKHKKHKSEKKSREVLEDLPLKEKEKEPLKIVLKVGASESVTDAYPHEERRHKHKKKKKKKSSEKDRHRHHDEERPKKHAREEAVEEMEVTQEEVDEPPPKKRALSLSMEEEQGGSGEQSRHTTPSYNKEEDEHGILRMCLQYLQKTLQNKDVNGFFANPVTDVIAPGYTSIITQPMDFSTMNAKIENDEYKSVMEYKKDFTLMCNNAMTYNRPETIYYKEAKRIVQSGAKVMSKDKLISMRKNLGFMGNITNEELGIEEPEVTSAIIEAIAEEERMDKKMEKARSKLGKFEAIPDKLTPQQILAQAQAAAAEAADAFTLRQPKTKYSFLRRKEDGTTSLTVLNPENDGIVSETERVVNLKSIVGKLSSGAGSIAGYREDKRNKVTPVNYLNYGPFSSYAPTYDSSFANITRDHSDLLLSAYGDETGTQYAKSVMSFVENAGDYAVKIVDNLLDLLTNGEHSKAQRLIQQKEKEAAEMKSERQKGTPDKIKGSDVDISSLRSLSDLGVDVSFLDQFEKETKKDPVQEKLDQTASLIKDLQQTQRERLGSRPPSHLAHVPGPTEKEIRLAQKVTEELTKLAKEANPGAVSRVEQLRAAMGISMNPVDVSQVATPAATTSTGTSDQTGSAGEEVVTADIDNELTEFLQQGSGSTQDKNSTDLTAS